MYVTIKQVMAATAAVTGVSVAQIKEKNNTPKRADARRVVVEVATRMDINPYHIGTGLERSQTQIAKLRDYSKLYYKIYDDFKDAVDGVIQHLKDKQK